MKRCLLSILMSGVSVGIYEVLFALPTPVSVGIYEALFALPTPVRCQCGDI